LSQSSVLCLVPRGLEGRGGIERLFLYLRDRAPEGVRWRFQSTRGGQDKPSHLAFVEAFGTVAWAAITRSADLVHVNLSVRGSAYRKALLVELAKRLGLKVVVHYHGGGFDKLIDAPLRWVRLNRHTLKRADAVVALGDYWRDLFVDKVGTDPARTFVVYNAVPDFAAGFERAPNTDGPLRIAFAGAVGTRKGVDLLVGALVRMGTAVDWRCVVAGDGDPGPFRAALAEAGLSDRVEFPGWVSSQDVHRIMLDADVVVLPSRAEALPVSLIEGAAAGAALVCSDAGASAEIVEDGVCGYVVPTEAAPLAEALTRLAEDRALLARMQAAARTRYLERFTVERMSAGLGRVYASVLAKRR
jgi:glycosyltransferase involved in cell wall biosynthesis